MANQRDINRWKKGKDHWNKWAEGRLKAKERIEKSGSWHVDERGNALNPSVERWIENATVDFSAHTFEKTADFYGLIFPWKVNFSNSTFHEIANFGDAQFMAGAYYGETFFRRETSFDGVTFSEEVFFSGSHFEDIVSFDSARFFRRAHFNAVKFSDKVGFNNCRFLGTADFVSATFASEAIFEGTRFSNVAEFNSASFLKDANFRRVEFIRSLSLENTTFASPPDLEGTMIPRGSDLESVRFQTIPLVRILTAARLRTIFPQMLRFFRLAAGIAENEKEEEKWRSIRQKAREALDHDLEQAAFAAELKSKRYWKWPIWRLDLYTASYFYGVFSDFGRSLFRPIFGWSMFVVGFAAYYGVQAANGYGSCDWKSPRLLPELYLSFLHSLPIVGFGRGEKRELALKCLFGSSADVTPAMDMLFIGQNIFSALFVFLFLLAVRNHFRIK